jgi:hypothetical protein
MEKIMAIKYEFKVLVSSNLKNHWHGESHVKHESREMLLLWRVCSDRAGDTFFGYTDIRATTIVVVWVCPMSLGHSMNCQTIFFIFLHKFSSLNGFKNDLGHPAGPYYQTRCGPDIWEQIKHIPE